MTKVSRFSVLTRTQYDALRTLSSDFAEPKVTIRANTLYALQKLGFAEPERKFQPARQVVWRRTEKGTAELNRLIGGKD